MTSQIVTVGFVRAAVGHAAVEDATLQALIDSADLDIRRLYGPHTGSRTEQLLSSGIKAWFSRIAETITLVTEGSDNTVVGDDEYTVFNNGRSVGKDDNSAWLEPVTATYTPFDDLETRRAVLVDMVTLALQYEGIRWRGVGGLQAQHVNHKEERENLLSRLAQGHPGAMLA